MSKICLCGSYDDAEEIYKVSRILLQRYIVFTPAFYLGRRPKSEEQVNLMDAHFERIKIADKVLFILATKVGANTLIELGYALAHAKPIYVLSNDKVTVPNEIISYFIHRNIVEYQTKLLIADELLFWISK